MLILKVQFLPSQSYYGPTTYLPSRADKSWKKYKSTHQRKSISTPNRNKRLVVSRKSPILSTEISIDHLNSPTIVSSLHSSRSQTFVNPIHEWALTTPAHVNVKSVKPIQQKCEFCMYITHSKKVSRVTENKHVRKFGLPVRSTAQRKNAFAPSTKEYI